MCDPVTIGVTSAVVGTASAVMGFEGSRQAYNANANMANMQASQSFNSLESRRGQIDAQQSENTLDAIIQRAQNEGAISAHAGSFGLGGSTTQRLVNATDFAVGRNLSIENLNSENQRVQLHDDLVSTDLQRQAKINSVDKANPLGLVLGIAKAGLQGAGAYSQAGGTFGGSKGGTGGKS